MEGEADKPQQKLANGNASTPQSHMATPVISTEIESSPPKSEVPLSPPSRHPDSASPTGSAPKPAKPIDLPESCNVVDCSTGKQQFWRFNKGKNQMRLVDVRETAPDEPIQAKYLERDTSQLWNAHCQNDAWLPAEIVFFRVLQLPLCEPRELYGMVELQLDKISPLPLGQAVWTYETTPVYRTDREQQTVVVMIAERAVVEKYVGELEKVGYRPDRLETPVLHQVMATPQGGKRPDGAWIYPRLTDEERVICTVAWWDEGVLHNITQITLTSREHLNELTGQLTATTWAGEMEGWLTGKTDWHLVVSNKEGEEWLPILNEWAGQGVQVQKPSKDEELANVSAARANRALDQGNLLPHDRRASYHREDVDRAIGTFFGWGLLVYILLLAGYFVFASQVKKAAGKAKDENKELTKANKELKSLLVQKQLLGDQLELRMTALNVLKAVAEYIPEELTLDSVTFNESRGSSGNNIQLRGKVVQEHRQKLQGYSDQLAKVKVPDSRTQNEKILFSQVQPPNMDARAGGYLDWLIVCLLRREEQGQ